MILKLIRRIRRANQVSATGVQATAVGVNRGVIENHYHLSQEIEDLPVLSADELFDGPIAARGMDADVHDAQELEKAGEALEAARRYGIIAARLDGDDFHPIAEEYRHRQALALLKAGKEEESVDLLLRLAWDAIHRDFNISRAKSWWYGVKVSGLQMLPEATKRAINALLLAMRVPWSQEANSFEALDECVAAFEGDEPYQLPLAVFAAEWYNAVARSAPSSTSIASYTRVLAETPDGDPDLRLRLGFCLAEFTSDWTALFDLTGSSGRRRAWAQARHGRAEAFQDPQRAEGHYRLAVKEALRERMGSEAAEWNPIRWNLLAWTGTMIFKGPAEQRRMLAALSATSGDKAIVPRIGPLERSAKSGSMKPSPDRLAKVRMWLWASVVGGFLTQELEACHAMGNICERSSRPIEALRWYSRAGAAKDAKEHAAKLTGIVVGLKPDDPFLCAPNSQPASFSAMAACANLVTDEVGSLWCESALAVLDKPWKGRHPALTDVAATIIATLADTCTESQADAIVELIRRQKGELPAGESLRYHREYASILACLIQENGTSAISALELALQILRDDTENFGEDLVVRIQRIIKKYSGLVWNMLETELEENPLNRVLCLIFIAAFGLSIRSRVEKFITQYVADFESWTPPDGTTHSYGFSHWELGLVAEVLTESELIAIAQVLLNQAECRADVAKNRQNALHDLNALAAKIRSSNHREAIFRRVIRVALGEFDGSADDADRELFSDPLGFVRMQGFYSSIRGAGVHTAAALAATPEQYSMVLDCIIDLLRSETEPKVLAEIAESLVHLPVAQIPVHIPKLLATHVVPSVRAAAAVCLVRAGTMASELKSLANDPQDRVRERLVSAIADSPSPLAEYSSLLENLRKDAHMRVRHIANRIQ
ncbi:hypothetical protein [Glycomyces sp. MUSA5-2]|uniref:hypothetical protein n=1 Tax=Glycomyces sp. MUSA5-2 TaxID=2053002 RepID=UPI003008D9E2